MKRGNKAYCFIAFRHCHKQVLLLTCADTLASVSGDVEFFDKVELKANEAGWGVAGEIAYSLAIEKNYKVFSKDQFFTTGRYPNYEDYSV